MRNALWKLAALACVVGVGVAVVVQTQRGMKLSLPGFGLRSPAEPAADGEPPAPDAEAPEAADARSRLIDDGEDDNPFSTARTESEPTALSENSEPVGAASLDDNPFADGEEPAVAVETAASVDEENPFEEPEPRVAPRAPARPAPRRATPGAAAGAPVALLDRRGGPPPRAPRPRAAAPVEEVEEPVEVEADPFAESTDETLADAALTDESLDEVPRTASLLDDEEIAVDPAHRTAAPRRVHPRGPARSADDDLTGLSEFEEPPAQAPAPRSPAPPAALDSLTSDEADGISVPRQPRRGPAARESADEIVEDEIVEEYSVGDRDDYAPEPTSRRTPRASRRSHSHSGAGLAREQRPQLTIEKVAPPDAILGQPLIYKILVKNVGTSPAHEVLVEDDIPAGSELTGTIPRAELSGDRLIWKLGELPAGESRTIQVRVIPVTEGDLGSIATVNFVSEVAAQTRITAPRLQFGLSAPANVRLGEPVQVTFHVANIGSGDASGVTIHNLLPDALVHPGGNDLEYAIGLLPAGKTRDISLTLTAARAGSLLNRAVVTADGGIEEPAEMELNILGPIIQVHRSGPDPHFLNRTAVYTNTIGNEGGDDVSKLSVVESVPAGFEFVEATGGGRYDPVRRCVSWQLDRLAPSKQIELKVSLIARKAGTQTSEIRVYDGQRNLAESLFNAETAGVPSLNVEMSALSAPLGVGEKIDYEIRLVNRGTDAAKRTRVRLRLPGELQISDLDGPVAARRKGAILDFETIDEIGPNEAAVFKMTLTAAAVGDARMQVLWQAQHLTKPVMREESLLVVPADR